MKTSINIMITIVGLAAICLMHPFGAMAQTWSQVNGNPAFYYGEGRGATLEEADHQALTMLVSQISMNVVVSTDQKISQIQENGQIVADNLTFQYAAKTYTQATLENSTMVTLEDAPNAHVARWILKSDFEKVLQGRRNKIQGMIEAAERAKEKGKVDVALKNYYWAFVLVKSMPQSNTESYNGHTLMAWLPEQIDDVMSDIRISVTKIDGDDVELFFTYQGKPVNSLDFRYSDGGFPSSICSAKDGYGLMELSPGVIHGTYFVDVEYEYRGQSAIDSELMSVMSIVPEAKLHSASFTVKKQENASGELPIPESLVKNNSFTEIEDDYFELPTEISDNSTFATIISSVENAIRNKSYSDVRPLMTDNAQGIFNKLIKYGQAKIIGTPNYTYTSQGENVLVRGLKMSFSFQHGVRKNFTQDLVFTINSDNKIDNITFGLGKTTEDDILGQSAYPVEARQILAQFLENYQTAYALGRLDYIKQLFDDNAIIIVGQVLQTPTNGASDLGLVNLNPKIKYNRYNKDTYLKKLTESFASKEFINLRFNKTDVRKSANGGEIYGIQLEQDYYSSNYCDHGYLFLELNLNDNKNPLILIRTWQPQPDPNFGIYSLEDFPIQKFD